MHFKKLSESCSAFFSFDRGVLCPLQDKVFGVGGGMGSALLT
jgi:hypothetical protein